MIPEIEMGWCGCGRMAELDSNGECSACRDAAGWEAVRQDGEDRCGHRHDSLDSAADCAGQLNAKTTRHDNPPPRSALFIPQPKR